MIVSSIEKGFSHILTPNTAVIILIFRVSTWKVCRRKVWRAFCHRFEEPRHAVHWSVQVHGHFLKEIITKIIYKSQVPQLNRCCKCLNIPLCDNQPTKWFQSWPHRQSVCVHTILGIRRIYSWHNQHKNRHYIIITLSGKSDCVLYLITIRTVYRAFNNYFACECELQLQSPNKRALSTIQWCQ